MPSVDDSIGVTHIDVCMPTKDSEPVIGETLEALAACESGSNIVVDRLVVVDSGSDDRTVEIAREAAGKFGWEVIVDVEELPLQEARERCVELVKTEWFLFLDDDVRPAPDYFEMMERSMAPLVGGIQGRKGGGGDNAKWVRWRSHRAGTHASLVRTEAAEAVSFPEGLTVLEDEYLRQAIEERGYLWLFNHQASFEHENQGRHPTGWQEGYLGGAYGLTSFCYLARKIPAAVINGKSPIADVMRTLGWVYGWFS